jgi:hypothetical protein
LPESSGDESNLADSRLVFRPDSPEALLQSRLRKSVGLPADQATISHAAAEYNKRTDNSVIPNEREGIIVSAQEARLFDQYFKSVSDLERSKDSLMQKFGDQLTWLRVNNNVLAPAVDVGVLEGVQESVIDEFKSALPSGWTLRTWRARASYNVLRSEFAFMSSEEGKQLLRNVVGPSFLRGEWAAYEDRIDVVISSGDTASVLAKVSSETKLKNARVRLGLPVNAPAGRLDSAAGVKAGYRISLGGCSSNVTLRDVTQGRWVMLTAGHCVSNSGTAQEVQHNGGRIGEYRAGSAVNSVQGGALRDAALINLDPGQETGLMMHVGVPITTDPQFRGHAFVDYMTAWIGASSAQMVCFEGASYQRNRAPYVNAAALRGALQTVCGQVGPVTTDQLTRVIWWGGGWGEAVCDGDSGGLARIPSTNNAVGILSRSTTDRADLTQGSGFCGSEGYFYLIGHAVDYYATQGITLQAEDGLAMVKSIRANGRCLGRPGGTHWPGVAVTLETCPQEWRLLPLNQAIWNGAGPVGDDHYMIEHWGICARANGTAVDQGGCPGGPIGFPAATNMHWWITSTGGASFAIRSRATGQWVAPVGTTAVNLGWASSSWTLG